MFPEMRIYIAPETSRQEQVRIPKRRHSRRWQKKFRKKYGFKTVPTTVPKDGVVMHMGDVLICNVRTHAMLINEALRQKNPLDQPESVK